MFGVSGGVFIKTQAYIHDAYFILYTLSLNLPLLVSCKRQKLRLEDLDMRLRNLSVSIKYIVLSIIQ